MSRASIVLLLVAPTLVLACSSNPSIMSSSDAGADSTTKQPDTIETVARDLANAWCERMYTCMPGASIIRGFGDDAMECADRKYAYYLRSYHSPGASSDISFDRSCATALQSASCEDYIDMVQGNDFTKLTACGVFPPGLVADGGKCVYGAQCKSTFCASAEGTCGHCAPLLQKGASCASTDALCDPSKGLVCNGAQQCATGRTGGESCDSTNPCFANYLCKNGTCVPYTMGVGASCNPFVGDCSYAVAGLICNNQKSKCEAIAMTAQPGQPCGLGGPTGGMVMCAVGSWCAMDMPGFPNQESGTCVSGKPAMLGEKCRYPGVGLNGEACQGDDVHCVNGTCVIADTKSCN